MRACLSFTVFSSVAFAVGVAGTTACSSSSSPATAGSDSGAAIDSGIATRGDSGSDLPESGVSTDSGPAEGGSDGSTSTAGMFPFPKVISFGGTVVTAPELITVTFAGDSLATQLTTFGASVAASSYWDAVRAGYCIGSSCIGDGPAGTAVALSTMPAASYTDSAQGGPSTLQTYLGTLFTAGTLPPPTANSVYTIYFPVTTSITLDGSPSCGNGGFDGYHDQMVVGSQNVIYAIVPECTAPTMTPAITTLQNTTITASHELAESATDGIGTNAGSGFYLDINDPATWGWNDVQGGEVADLCVDPFGLGLDEATEGGFTVQRSWSITNAAAGKNPCVPVPSGEVYFNAYTEDSVVVMDVGQSKMITVDALADGPMPAWTLSGADWSGSSTYLTFSAPVQVKSGDKAQVTVTLTADPATAPNGEADGVMISANGSMTTATAAHFWPFIVLTTAEAADAGVTMMRRAPRKHAGRHFAPRH